MAATVFAGAVDEVDCRAGWGVAGSSRMHWPDRSLKELGFRVAQEAGVTVEGRLQNMKVGSGTSIMRLSSSFVPLPRSPGLLPAKARRDDSTRE